MDLKDILKKSESKLTDKKYSLRKATITRKDRPYIDVFSDTNGLQIEDVKGTISNQSDSNTKSTLKEYNKNTNSRQIDDINGTVSGQKKSYYKNKFPNVKKNYTNTSSSKKYSNHINSSNKKDTIGIQKVDKFNFIKVDKSIWNIHGNEKKLYFWIKSQCQTNNLITPPMSKDEIVNGTGIAVTCLKKTIDRLIEKKLINIYDSQNGRFGWRIFNLIS